MKIIIMLLVLCLPARALATLITFDFRSPSVELIDEVNSLSLLQNGLTATLTAFPDTFNEPPVRAVVLNQGSSSFGINVMDTSCGGLENLSQIDGGCVEEYIDIFFDNNVILNNIKVSSFGSLDRGLVTIGTTNIDILSTGIISLGDISLTAGDRLSVGWVAGNGFSFDNVTVSTVPEPDSSILFIIGVMTFFVGWKLFRRENRSG